MKMGSGKGVAALPATVNRGASRCRNRDAIEFEPREIHKVVRENLVDALPAGTVGVKGVVDRAARQADRGDMADNGAVVVLVERYDGKPINDRILDHEACLLGRDTSCDRECGHRRVALRESMRGAKPVVLAARVTLKGTEGGLVIPELVHQGRNQDGSIE